MFTNREERILLKQKMRAELCALNFVHAIKKLKKDHAMQYVCYESNNYSYWTLEV